MYRELLTVFALICSITMQVARSQEKTESKPCSDKFAILKTHSACRPPSSSVISAGLNQGDVSLIIEEHNRYRSQVQPPAADMIKLSWDDEIATVAQAWAETCALDHDEQFNRNIPGRFTLGQNLGKGYGSWVDCIKDWNAEVKDFVYNTTNNFSKVGHYTQIVNSKTMKIGCGLARCGTVNFHVCNYAPVGNIGANQINMPYKSGQSCRDCKGHCSDKLCDCGGKACLNGGTLNLADCSCTCSQSFHIPNTCQLDCRDNLTESSMCSSYSKPGCLQFASFSETCPRTCNACPYGAYDYKEKGVVDTKNGATVLATSKTEMLVVVSLSVFAIFGNLRLHFLT